MHERHERYWRLIQSFHAMRHCPNLVEANGPQSWLHVMWMQVWIPDPQDPHMDDEVKWVVVFLLNVWSTGGTDRPWPAFDLFRAMGAWDDAHRKAFIQWCANPVRP